MATVRSRVDRGAIGKAIHGATHAAKRTAAHARSYLAQDWHADKSLPAGAVVLGIALAVVAAYYVTLPQIATFSDTEQYLAVTQRLLAGGPIVDVWRGPGYPLMIALIWLLFGRGNLAAVSVAQGVLFALAALETYALALLILRRVWMALGIGVLVGGNVFVLSFVKPILSEGLALWLTVTFALMVALFIRTLRPRDFWIAVAVLIALVFTRWEWLYLPLPLFAYFVIVAAQRGGGRRVLAHVVAATVVLYALVGAYIAGNMASNGYTGVSLTGDINLLGKVMQYRMQHEAPPRYRAQTAAIDAFLAHGGFGPYALFVTHPELTRDNYALTRAYAHATVLAHPLEFAVKTVQLIPATLNEPAVPMVELAGHGDVAGTLQALQAGSLFIYNSLGYFLLGAALWGALLVFPRTRRSLLTQMMGALVLIALYDLGSTAAGGYESYRRLHLGSDPLMIVVVWGSVFVGVSAVAHLLRIRQPRPPRPANTGHEAPEPAV